MTMVSRHILLPSKVVEFQFCSSQTELLVGCRCRGKVITVATATIITTSGRRHRRGGEVAQNCGALGYISRLCKDGRYKKVVDILNLLEEQGFPAYSDTCACLLQECAETKSLADGKEIHAHIIKSGFKPDIFLGNTLVSMYVKCGNVVDARQVFDKMPQRNVISWNVMIAGLAQQGGGEGAFALFEQMQREGVKANKITFISILNACGTPAELEHGRRLHAGIIKARFEADVRLGTALISMYCKCGSVVNAREVFFKMSNRNVVSWNAMIAGLVQKGKFEEAFELFWEMQLEGMTPNKGTFVSILNACTIPAALEQGRWVHADIIEAGFESDIRVGNALVSMYCKCGSVRDARPVFDGIRNRDVISWTAIIAGFAQHGHVGEAFEIFRQMQREGIKADKVTFICILKACTTPAALPQGKRLHAGIIKAGFESDIQVGTALVSMYCKCGSVVDACQVLFKMPQRNVVSWNAMIAGLAHTGHVEEAFDRFQQMQQEGMKPNKVTFISILNACATQVALEQGKWVHEAIIKAGFEADVRVGNALVSMYCKCGSLLDARQVFLKMPERDIISWNSMIAGSDEHGLGVESFELFGQMRLEGVKPNKVTFILILNACGHLAALEEGKKVHDNILKSGSESDVCVGTALIDMYAKCGSLRDAKGVFDNILEHSTVSWTAMITGCAQNGHGKDALQLFEQMQREGVKPDSITFIGVLFACSHVGLVDEGHHYFLSMTRDHCIIPTEKHYGCMVDLLGRAGLLDQAKDFMNRIPFEPGASVLGALLGACRIHGNVELAEHFAECLWKLETKNAAVHVLLSNVYALAGRWDDVTKVRKTMEEGCEKGDSVKLD